MDSELQKFGRVQLPERIEDEGELAYVVQQKHLIEGWITKATAFFAPLKKKAHEAHKALTQRESEELAPARIELAVANGLLADWQTRAREIAEREAAKTAAAAAAAAKLAAEKTAAVLEQAGQGAMATRVREHASTITPKGMGVKSDPPKIAGLGFMKVSSVEVVDPMALLRFIVEHPEFLELVEWNTVMLEALRVEAGEAFSLPGTRIVTRDVPVSR